MKKLLLSLFALAAFAAAAFADSTVYQLAPNPLAQISASPGANTV